FRGNRETGRDGHAEIRHLGQIGALSAQERLHVTRPFRAAISEEVDGLARHRRRGLLVYDGPMIETTSALSHVRRDAGPGGTRRGSATAAESKLVRVRWRWCRILS